MAGNKYIANSAGTLTEVAANQVSAGAGDAGKIVALDATGRIDTSMMPTGIGADTAAITTSEALAAGDFVNVFNNAGTPNVRKADASVAGKEAMGFVLAAFGAAATATVFFEGTNTQVTGQTAGKVFLSATTPGKTTSTAPATAGQVVQVVGFATSATTVNCQIELPITLA